MWLEGVTCGTGVFLGKLGNEPEHLRNYRYGQRVTVKADQISDWMILSNNRLVGGYYGPGPARPDDPGGTNRV